MALLIFLWTLYFSIHSFLASGIAKRYAVLLLGKSFRFYRLGYNLFALVSFAAIWYYQSKIEPQHVFQANKIRFYAGGVLAITGTIVGMLAFYQYRWQEFMGLDQVKEKSSKSAGKLVTNGINQYVRHPLYFAAILFLTGYSLINVTLPVIIFTLITLLYLIIGTRLEEKKLLDEYGEDYRSYQKRVKMLIPFIF